MVSVERKPGECVAVLRMSLFETEDTAESSCVIRAPVSIITAGPE